MGKKKKKKTNNNTKIDSSCPQIVNIDYNMLTKAIVEAQFAYEEEKAKRQEEKRRRRRIEVLTDMGLQKYIDDNGATKKDLKWSFKMYIFLKMFVAREKHLAVIICGDDEMKDTGLLSDCVNIVVSVIFLLIEWFLYILSIFLVLKPFVFDRALNFGNAHSIAYGISIFLGARIFIRFLKIECKYNNDKNYMINFLVCIISVMALIVAVLTGVK